MKALVWNKDNGINFVDKPIPKIENATDAIVKVKMSSICTSDLHIIKGYVPRANSGIVLGHEFVGEIIDIGSEITNLKKGDRVSANCETFCGECFYCKRGYVNNCINGGWELGCTIDGCQAEYVRVPYADNSLTKIPDNLNYKDSLFVGDILSSGYFGAELCEIKNGDVVAIIGCGPVGICAMQCAKIMGASTIIGIDKDNYRLNLAKEHGFADAVINPEKDDYMSIIKSLTQNRGADGVIEAAGGDNTFELAWKLARPNAVVALVAMYESIQSLPLPDMYGKNLVFKTGGVDAIHCEKLLKFISEGKINTNILISEEVHFNNIIQAYKDFEAKKNNCLKIAVIYD